MSVDEHVDDFNEPDAVSEEQGDDLAFTRAQLVKGALGTAGGLALLSAFGGSAAAGVLKQFSRLQVPTPTVKPVIDGDLNWFTWAQFVPPEVVKGFENEYKVKVHQSFMASDEEYVQKLAAGLPYDLITTNNGYMPQTLAGNLVQPFDPNDLKNFKHLLPYFKQPYWDKGRYRYTMPYDYGPTGIMYRADRVNHITHSWNDMWSNPEAKGHIYLLSAIGDTLGMALLRNGYYCNSAVPAQVNKAANDLLKLKPWVASFTTNDGPPIASGDAWLMEGWGTPIYQGLLQAKDPHNIRFFVPKEGPLMACDTLSIGRKAKHPGTALLFIDWLLRPDNNAALAKYIILKTGTTAGNAAFAQQVKKYPDFNFSDALIKNRKNWKIAPVGSQLQLWNQAWSRVTA